MLACIYVFIFRISSSDFKWNISLHTSPVGMVVLCSPLHGVSVEKGTVFPSFITWLNDSKFRQNF